MIKHLTATLLAAAGIALCVPAVAAEPAAAPAKKAQKKPAKKAAAKKHAPVAAHEPEPDVAGSVKTEFTCELGTKVTVYQKPEDEANITLRWNKHMHEMSRMGTSSGANRFEESKSGLVWLNLPTKGILLDSHKGQQLANECQSHGNATAHGMDHAKP